MTKIHDLMKTMAPSAATAKAEASKREQGGNDGPSGDGGTSSRKEPPKKRQSLFGMDLDFNAIGNIQTSKNVEGGTSDEAKSSRGAKNIGALSKNIGAGVKSFLPTSFKTTKKE